jgi:hypothetical protein
MRMTIAVTALMLSLPAAHAQQAVPASARYSLKDGLSRGGRMTDPIATGELPFNVPYAKLSSEQQRRLKALYERMEDDDEPPYPAHGVAPIYRALAEAPDVLGNLKGELVLHVDVDSEGNATSVAVIKTPDERINRYAAAVVMREKYKPALCSGKPCRMQFPIAAEFQ